MKRTVLLFSGQGAQAVGMGKDLAQSFPVAKQLFEQADELLGYSLSSLMFEGPEDQLLKTAHCQPALFVHGLAILAILKEHCPDLSPVATAGLSLGELTAHTAAGTFSFEDGLKLVAQRGQLMDLACSSTKGAMAAVIGGEEHKLQELAQECSIDIANYNCPGQMVLSGSVEGVQKAVSLAKEYGARMAKPLKVAGAYHSKLMSSAEESFTSTLANTSIQPPEIPVIANFSAQPALTEEEIRHTLAKQITGSVRWTESMRYLINKGYTQYLELGPGKVLAGLMGRIDKSVPITSIEDKKSLETFLS